MEHTLGPWKVSNAYKDYIVNKKGTIIAQVKEKDAQLIASAPEMLEALKEELISLQRERSEYESDIEQITKGNRLPFPKWKNERIYKLASLTTKAEGRE